MNVSVIYKKSFYELEILSGKEKESNFPAQKLAELIESHEAQTHTLDVVIEGLEQRHISYEAFYRGDLPTMHHRDLDIVIGGDGTVLEVAHYLLSGETPIMSVNSHPLVDGKRGSVGFFSCCDAHTFDETFDALDKLKKNTFHRLRLVSNGVQLPQYALNDVSFGYKLHGGATSFLIRDYTNNIEIESVKNGELLVCTAAGSTARMKKNNGVIMPIDDSRMQYKLLESGCADSFFSNKLEVYSNTQTADLSIDGCHVRYDFTHDTKVEITANHPITILGDFEEKRKVNRPSVFYRPLIV